MSSKCSVSFSLGDLTRGACGTSGIPSPDWYNLGWASVFLPPSLSLYLSLSLSLTHTHTHTHTRARPRAHTHAHRWPLAVGQDWLAAMDETHRLTNPQTAVECSFMAPGLGPWRPVSPATAAFLPALLPSCLPKTTDIEGDCVVVLWLHRIWRPMSISTGE